MRAFPVLEIVSERSIVSEADSESEMDMLFNSQTRIGTRRILTPLVLNIAIYFDTYSLLHETPI
jgi:hypothetical protein